MTVRHLAVRHIVTGWVCNEPDGSVRVEIQGEPEQVRALLRAIDERMHAHIKDRRDTPLAVKAGETGFEISTS